MTNGGESMKYKNPEDNLYDTKHYKNVATQPIDVKMVDKLTKQAESILRKYKYAKFLSFVFLFLCLFDRANLFFLFLSVGYLCYLKYYKNIEVNYRLTERQKDLYNQAVSDIRKVKKSRRVYWIKSQSKVRETRYTSGASNALEAVYCRVLFTPPFPFETNINILSVQLKNDSVSFFPDRIVIIQDGCISTASYESLKCEYEARDYVENEDDAPSDTQILYMTWRYVNNDGSRDRRFKNNCQLPVCAYGKLTITAGKALNLVLYFSNRTPFET